MSEGREPTTGEIMEVLLAFRDAVELQFERVFKQSSLRKAISQRCATT